MIVLLCCGKVSLGVSVRGRVSGVSGVLIYLSVPQDHDQVFVYEDGVTLTQASRLS